MHQPEVYIYCLHCTHMPGVENIADHWSQKFFAGRKKKGKEEKGGKKKKKEKERNKKRREEKE